MERIKVLSNVRVGLLPDEFVKQWPKESMLVLWMTTNDDYSRPSVSDVLKFELSVEHCEGLNIVNSAQAGRISDVENSGVGEHECLGCRCCKASADEIHALKSKIDDLELELDTARVNLNKNK
jgi:hypothetical protein